MTMYFKSKKDAVSALCADELLIQLSDDTFTYAGIYELHHNEADKPIFKPVRYKKGWGIKKVHCCYISALRQPKDGLCVKLGNDYTLVDNL